MLRHSNGKPLHPLLLKIAAGNTLVTLNVWLPSILKVVLTKALQSLQLSLGGGGGGEGYHLNLHKIMNPVIYA